MQHAIVMTLLGSLFTACGGEPQRSESRRPPEAKPGGHALLTSSTDLLLGIARPRPDDRRGDLEPPPTERLTPAVPRWPASDLSRETTSAHHPDPPGPRAPV